MKKLSKYFKSQFKDLNGAKLWYRKWRDEWDQDIVGHPEWSGDNCFSLRAMAGHISHFLENGITKESYEGVYMWTKHGSDIYFS